MVKIRSLKPHFPADRKDEALVATSASFWRIARKRVSHPEYKRARAEFIRAFKLG
jgi:hypothetical protein